MTTIITRYAGMDVYGMVAVMAALSAILSNLLTFRTNEAVISFYKRGQLEGNLGLCRLALIAGMLLDCVVGLLLFGLMRFFALDIAESLLKRPEFADEVALYSWVILATFVRGTAVGLLAAEERFNYVSGVVFAEALLKVFLLLVFLWRDKPFDLQSVVFTNLVSSISITFLLYRIPAKKLLLDLRYISTPFYMFAEYFKFSVSTFLSSSLKAGNQNVDTLIIGFFINPTQVGFYSLFRQFLAPISMIATPFASQIYPRFVQCVVERKRDLMRDTIRSGNRILLVGFLVAAGLIAPALYFYGQWNGLSFTTDHFTTFGVMAFGTLLLQQMWWARALSLSLNPNWSIYAGILSSAVMIFAGSLFVWLCGLVGAAITGLLSALLLTVYWNIKLRTV